MQSGPGKIVSIDLEQSQLTVADIKGQGSRIGYSPNLSEYTLLRHTVAARDDKLIAILEFVPAWNSKRQTPGHFLAVFDVVKGTLDKFQEIEARFAVSVIIDQHYLLIPHETSIDEVIYRSYALTPTSKPQEYKYSFPGRVLDWYSPTASSLVEANSTLYLITGQKRINILDGIMGYFVSRDERYVIPQRNLITFNFPSQSWLKYHEKDISIYANNMLSILREEYWRASREDFPAKFINNDTIVIPIINGDKSRLLIYSVAWNAFSVLNIHRITGWHFNNETNTLVVSSSRTGIHLYTITFGLEKLIEIKQKLMIPVNYQIVASISERYLVANDGKETTVIDLWGSKQGPSLLAQWKASSAGVMYYTPFKIKLVYQQLLTEYYPTVLANLIANYVL